MAFASGYFNRWQIRETQPVAFRAALRYALAV